LDRNIGGVTVLPPYEKSVNSEWYTGTANAIYQNIDYIDSFNPEYVLILSGDHIYKMDYEAMLGFHKENNAEVTIAVMPVPMEEAKRFGIMITDENKRITDFEEKPEHPRSNLASMGIYIFNWKTLKDALVTNSEQPALDFGKHVIPYCHKKEAPLYAYEFNGYWKDVGTLSSYWEANMELIDIVPEFNLYEEYWKIYTSSTILPPQYISEDSVIERSIIGEGSNIYGKVYNSVIGCGVTIEKDTVVRDSIIMNETYIGKNCELYKAIIAENVTVNDNVKLGIGEEAPNETDPHIYNNGMVTIGEKSIIPNGVQVGKNSVIFGVTKPEDYPDGYLASGKTLIKAGDEK
jgi:glucose-1-phosphate adenylyltransferase